GVEVEEAEGGKQRPREEERRGERAGKALAPRAQSTDGYECRHRVEVFRESDRIDVPARIDEDEVGRPHELAEIEPGGAAGDQAPLRGAEIECRAFGAHQAPL